MTSMTVASEGLDLRQANDALSDASAEEVVAWAARQFGDGLAMTSSFGIQSAVMLHLVTTVAPGTPVILLDTGYLFPETYAFVEEMRQRLNLNLKVYTPRMSAARMEAVHGRLWEGDAQQQALYAELTKLEPMRRAIEELGVTSWLAGLRSDQTDLRAGLDKVTLQAGTYKVHPILGWSARDVHEYLKQHDLPYHPLRDQNFASVGDVHSSRPLSAEDAHERDTRFGGLKQECGLHLPSTVEEDQSREGSNL